MIRKNKENGRNALKAGIWYTVSSITVKSIAILTTPIFTRMMSAGDYGMATTFTSWYSLLMIFCSLNLTYSIGRAKLDFPGKLDEYVGAMQLLSFIVTLIFFIFIFPFVGKLASFMEMNIPLMYILMVHLLLHPAINFTQSKFRYSYNYKENIGITAYISVTTVVITLMMMLVFKEERYYAKVIGSVIPAVALSLVIWGFAIRKNTVHINISYWKYGLEISLPLILHSVSLNILSQSDRLMITKFCGTDNTGIYSLAYSYAILINIILSAVNEAWLPWFHDSFFEGDISSIRKNIKPLVTLGGMLGIGCIAIAPEIMIILGPREYRAGQWAVAPITVGVVCQFMYQQYVHIELHEKKTKYISFGTVIAACINIFLNLLFIPKFGFIAAAYTTLICYFVLVFVHLYITRVVMKIQLYDDWFMFTSLGAIAIVAMGFMQIYHTVLLRYAILTVICIIYLIFNKDYLIRLIGKRKYS